MHTVRVGDSTCGVQREAQRDICETSGLEQHYGALILLGVFVALLALGAAVGRSRPAAFGLVFVGVVVLFIALVLDRPTLDDTQGFEAYNAAEGVKGGGYTLEIIGGALAIATGVLALIADRVGSVAVPRPRLPKRRGAGGGGDDPDADDPELAEDEREERRRRREAKRAAEEAT